MAKMKVAPLNSMAPATGRCQGPAALRVAAPALTPSGCRRPEEEGGELQKKVLRLSLAQRSRFSADEPTVEVWKQKATDVKLPRERTKEEANDDTSS